MPTSFKIPGVSIEQPQNVFPRSLQGIETAIPAFIGYTEVNTNHVAVQTHKNANADTAKFNDVEIKAFATNANRFTNVARIKSITEFEYLFGSSKKREVKVGIGADNTLRKVQISGENYRLFHSLQLFFENGGKSCFVVSIGSYDNEPSKADFIEGIKAIEDFEDITLVLAPDAVDIKAMSAADKQGDFAEIQKTILSQCARKQNRFAVLDVLDGFRTGKAEIDALRNNLGVQDLNYGAAYHPWLITTIPFGFDENSIYTHTDYDDSGFDTVYDENADASSTTTLVFTLKQFVENKGPRINPFILENLLEEINTNIRAKHMILPPSAAIVGQMAKMDQERGVFAAPANVALQGIVGPALFKFKQLSELQVGNSNDSIKPLFVEPPLSDTILQKRNVTQGEFALFNDIPSGKSVNVIKGVRGKGNLILGARTLDGNSGEWRYIPVRRSFLFVEESLKRGLDAFVFQPNDANSWTNIKIIAGQFLKQFWQNGGLFGTTPEQAYFVRVGLGESMTQDDILDGRMIVEIGLALVRPAEFIVVKVVQNVST